MHNHENCNHDHSDDTSSTPTKESNRLALTSDPAALKEARRVARNRRKKTAQVRAASLSPYATKVAARKARTHRNRVKKAKLAVKAAADSVLESV